MIKKKNVYWYKAVMIGLEKHMDMWNYILPIYISLDFLIDCFFLNFVLDFCRVFD